MLYSYLPLNQTYLKSSHCVMFFDSIFILLDTLVKSGHLLLDNIDKVVRLIQLSTRAQWPNLAKTTLNWKKMNILFSAPRCQGDSRFESFGVKLDHQFDLQELARSSTFLALKKVNFYLILDKHDLSSSSLFANFGSAGT